MPETIVFDQLIEGVIRLTRDAPGAEVQVWVDYTITDSLRTAIRQRVRRINVSAADQTALNAAVTRIQNAVKNIEGL